MITWIQLRTQKHIKLISFILMVVVVVPFVFVIGNQNFFGSHDDGHFKSKDFYGYNLASENTNAYLQQSAQLSAMLSREQMMGPNHMRDPERYGKERAAALAMAKMLGIAEPTEEQLRAYIRAKAMFQDEQGKFSATNYKNMIEFFEVRQGIPEASVLKIFSEDYRIEKVRQLLGGAGFVNPSIIALDRQNMGTEWTLSVAKTSLAAFKPAINADDATLKAYYDNNKSRFEIKERLRLNQVRFPAVSFAGKVVMPDDKAVQAFFEGNKFRYAQNGAEPTLDTATRARVVQDYVQANAVQLASQKADEFTLALWRESLTYDSPRIAELAKGMGAEISPVSPFARGDAPKNPDAASDELNGLWTLTTSERYFSDVIPSANGASVFVYQGTIPSRMPAYDEVKAQVIDAYTAEQRNILFVQYGKDLQKKIQSELASGKKFEDIAKENNLTTESFSGITIEKTTDRNLLRDGGPLDVASRLKVGGISAMQIDSTGGTFVYLANKVVPPFEAVKGKPEEVAIIRERFASVDSWEVLGAICDKRVAELDAELEAQSKAKK
jgi:peptidyl-prolyl cis-trans isomerase D